MQVGTIYTPASSSPIFSILVECNHCCVTFFYWLRHKILTNKIRATFNEKVLTNPEICPLMLQVN